jgi:hypothetical protein
MFEQRTNQTERRGTAKAQATRIVRPQRLNSRKRNYIASNVSQNSR